MPHQYSSRLHISYGGKKYAAVFLLSLAFIALVFTTILPQVAFASVRGDNGSSCSPTNATLGDTGTPAASLASSDANSLLIVVINDSACMSQADPTNYSASMTDALSDMWLGPMAIVQLHANRVTTIGPTANSVRNDLKTQVDHTPFSGNTSLEQGMSQVQTIFKQQGSPKGSRIVVLTAATGMTVNTQVLSQSIKTFAQEGLVVNTYGIAVGVSSDAGTVSLLQDMANATGGSYQGIGNAANMSNAVINFCQLNCGDHFTPIAFNSAHHDYIILLQGASLNLLTFYDTGTGRNILGYAGHQLGSPQLTQSQQNNHYEFDTISLQQKCPCNITLAAGNDTNVLVYEFKTGYKTVPPPPPPPKTRLNLLLIIAAALLLLVTVLYILWRRKHEVTGTLVREPVRSDDDWLNLGEHRPRLKRIFSKGTITLKELAKYSIVSDLLGEPLAFVATREGVVLRLTRGTTSSVSVRTFEGQKQFSETKRTIPLSSGDTIFKDSRAVVIFK